MNTLARVVISVVALGAASEMAKAACNDHREMKHDKNNMAVRKSFILKSVGAATAFVLALKV